MRIVILAIAMIALALPARAEDPDFSKYGKLAQADIKEVHGVLDVNELSNKIDALGKYATMTRVDLNEDVALLTKQVEQHKKEADYKFADIERRLTGVQKQVTVLHATKADNSKLQETRDQTANVVNMLRKRTAK